MSRRASSISIRSPGISSPAKRFFANRWDAPRHSAISRAEIAGVQIHGASTKWWTCETCLWDGSSALNNTDKDHDDRQHQQNVNETAQRVRGHQAQQPQNQKHDSD